MSSLENTHGKLTLARVESGTAASAGKPSASRSCSTDTAVSALCRQIQVTVNLDAKNQRKILPGFGSDYRYITIIC